MLLGSGNQMRNLPVGALSMPIKTIRFLIDLVSFPKQAWDIDLPPSLNHASDLPPGLGKKQQCLPRLGGKSGKHVAKLTSRLAGTSEHGVLRENQTPEEQPGVSRDTPPLRIAPLPPRRLHGAQKAEARGRLTHNALGELGPGAAAA